MKRIITALVIASAAVSGTALPAVAATTQSAANAAACHGRWQHGTYYLLLPLGHPDHGTRRYGWYCTSDRNIEWGL